MKGIKDYTVQIMEMICMNYAVISFKGGGKGKGGVGEREGVGMVGKG